MSGVTVEADGFVVDAELIGGAFDIEPSTVPEFMRQADITSRCETGIGEDEGRFRLTFFYDNKALCLTVDVDGAITGRTILPADQPRARGSG